MPSKRNQCKHGMSRTKLYQTWSDMKQRCNNKKNAFYYRYGGRGIRVCEEWLTFEPFMEWALANGYREDLTIDRIDNDGNYCPDNCKWSTQREQSMNKTHLPNKYGHKGIHASRKNGKLYGYKAEKIVDGKVRYLGFSKTVEGSIAILEQYG